MKLCPRGNDAWCSFNCYANAYGSTLNARLVMELGVGMEVERDKSGNENLVGGNIAKVFKQVVVQKGVEVRNRMREISKTMRYTGDGETNLVVEKPSYTPK
ncbi:hypothetical protein FRX31_002149 [Thalictrum thalictroides]|uniref:Uncharacterized protein n=1 Tax=Thalictrum thalictroides TaxID=46969 RepID=A0A7J6XGR6_THATH|nr:hypothetical protein FRX31_002149 [Thalictrum thalictroides]